MYEISQQQERERVVLAGVRLAGDDAAVFEQDMEEMAMLCETAGVEVVGRVEQQRDRPAASTYIGSGKLDDIRRLMRAHGSRTLIIDARLSPGQVRNIEETLRAKVVDRSQLILDIFAHHAVTTEAKTQVELAQMRTLYPRLTRAWSHFSRQYAGVGTKGPGEKQLEIDRRLVQKRIAELTRRLADIERTRATKRKARRRRTRIALVGYTNVGKSSLLNRLAHAQAHVEDKLFATLDTTTRRLFIPDVGEVVLSDTVGFLRKLPHHLVASFRSTLEAAVDTELLLVVLDASMPWAEKQRETVEEVLQELGARDLRRILVYNKVDLLEEGYQRKKLEVKHPEAVFVSAHTGEGIDELREQIALVLREEAKPPLAEAIASRMHTPGEDDLPGPPATPPRRGTGTGGGSE